MVFDYMMRVSVLIPAKNEAANLPHVLRNIPSSYIDEIILIDGKSTDETISTAKKIYPDIKILEQNGPLGKGLALKQGFKAAKGDMVIIIDADCSMNPKEIPLFIQKIKEGYDIVKGSRFIKGGYTEDMTTFRKFGNFLFVTLVNIFYKQKFTDLCYGYIAFRKGVFDKLEIQSKGFSVETEIVVKASKKKFRITEVPSFEKVRLHGNSNLRTIRDGCGILIIILKEKLKDLYDGAGSIFRG